MTPTLAAPLAPFADALPVPQRRVAARQIAVRRPGRLGPRRHLLLGVAASSLCIALLGLVGTATNLWLVRIVLVFMGMAVGQVFVATQAIFIFAKHSRLGRKGRDHEGVVFGAGIGHCGRGAEQGA
jgi:MFS family permease